MPDRSLAGTRAQGPRVGRRPRGQLPWRDSSASSDPALPLCCSLFSHQPLAKVSAPAMNICFFQRNKVSFYFMLLICVCLLLCLLVSSPRPLGSPSHCPLSQATGPVAPPVDGGGEVQAWLTLTGLSLSGAGQSPT